MLLDPRHLAWVVAILIAGLAVGCGSNEGDDGLSMSEAKSRLVDDCQDDDDSAPQKKACVCIADQLEKQKLTPKQIDGLRKVANDIDSDELDKIPAEFTKAITACAAEVAAAG